MNYQTENLSKEDEILLQEWYLRREMGFYLKRVGFFKVLSVMVSELWKNLRKKK